MLGLYIHVPFCSAICNYCNFNRGLFDAALKTRYVEALTPRSREAAGEAALRQSRRAAAVRAASRSAAAADTIYFGGGTPSLLEPDEIARIIARLRVELRRGGRPRGHAGGQSRSRSAEARLRGVPRRRRQSTELRRPVVPRGRTAAPLAPAQRRSRARRARRGARRRLRQRQPRPDDVAARAERQRVARVGRCARSRSRPSTCRSTCSRCIRTRRSRTTWRAPAGRRRPTTTRRRCTSRRWSASRRRGSSSTEISNVARPRPPLAAQPQILDRRRVARVRLRRALDTRRRPLEEHVVH